MSPQHFDRLKISFPSELKHLKIASQRVLDFLRDLKLGETVLFDIRLSFEEAFINAVKYGSQNDNRFSVDVEVAKKGNEVEVVVRDQGKGFDFEHAKDPTTEENRDKLSGRGVFLIKQLMDKVIFEQNGSCLRMIKKINT